MEHEQDVPKALRHWFVVHFIADLLFAIPLFIAPTYFLKLAGWTAIDPISTRLVCAALFGIGIESLLGRHGNRDEFLGMLRLKMIWSATASLGILWGVLDNGPVMAWGLFATFVVFNLLWSFWYFKLRAMK